MATNQKFDFTKFFSKKFAIKHISTNSLYWQNIPQTCYLVTLATICEEMRNASKNFLAFKGAPYMVDLISTGNFLNNSRPNDLLAKEVSRNLQKVPTRIMCNRGPKKFSLCLNSKSMREKREGGKGKTQWWERTPLSRRGFLSHYGVLPFPTLPFLSQTFRVQA